MTHLARVYLPLAFLFLSLAGGIAARGDDWPQFRRDARRSAWSLDAIPVPVFELWVWEGKIGAGTASIEMGVPALSRRPIGNCAVWKGRIFSVSLENSHPFLVCADVKTGYPLWRRRLNGSGAYRREVGPAVTPQGIVYVYDTVPLEEVQSRTLEDPDPDPQKPLRKSFFKVHLPASHVRLRAFRAVDGQPLGEHPLPSGFPRRQFNSLITRLWMLPGGEGRVALPGPSSHWRLADNHSLGPVLLSGESMAALSASDLLVRWHPAVRPSFLRVANGIDQIPAIQPPARFLGYPMAQSGNGMLIADDRGARFLAMVTMDSHLVWCRSVPWTLGLPAVASAMIYTGAGGPGAHSALVAIESGTGDTRWTYPPDGPAGDFTVAMKESWNLTLRSFDFEYEPVAPDEGMAVDLVNTYPLGPWSPPPIFRRVSAGRSTYFLTRPVIESTSGHEQNL
ncbi:MAG TPA: hypothetical protein VK689_11320, partial [Armatimonadota bacterium]|nr:hypothetical protein [Armatimonadota bacterium]